MTDTIVWLDKLPDIIKKWILVVPMILVAISSSTGVYQYFDKQSVIKEKDQAIREVATGFQQVMIEAEPKEKIVYKSNCGACKALLYEHERRLH